MPEQETIRATRDQLREEVDLTVGCSYRIQVREVGVDSPTLTIPAATFALDRSFPGPAILSQMALIEKKLEDMPQSRIVVFGHADASGSDRYNKRLSDRRARAVFALLTGNAEMFDAVAREDDWDLIHYQAMLRGMGCNPGEIDGQEGDRTRTAVMHFQEDYNRGAFKVAESQTDIEPIEENGVLNNATRTAIRHAYVASVPFRLPAGQTAGPGFAGCSEFNPISDDNAENRRVVVGFVNGQTPTDDQFPCREGDFRACQVDDGGRMRCRFYRRFFEEATDDDYPRFADLQWRREEETGDVFLSALTPVPDGETATFNVLRLSGELAEPVPSSYAGDEKPTGTEVDTISAEIAMGVCWTRWTPPEDFDPFDPGGWYGGGDTSDSEEGDDDLMAEPFVYELTEMDLVDPGRQPEPVDMTHSDDEPLDEAGAESDEDLESDEDADDFQPPVFVVESGAHWACSEPPGWPAEKWLVGGDSRSVLVLTNRGAIRSVSVENGKLKGDTLIASIIGFD